MTSLIRIALVTDPSYAYCREMVKGVLRYAKSQPAWDIMQSNLNFQEPHRLIHPDTQGIIGHLAKNRVNDVLRATGLPLVNTSGVKYDLPYPRFGVDDEAIGRMAAHHLIDKGLQTLMHMTGKSALGRARGRGFSEVVSDAKREGIDYNTIFPQMNEWDEFSVEAHSIRGAFLKSLPKPLGVFCEADNLAAQTIIDCRTVGLSVPGDVAILGVNNDQVLCEGTHPGISSIKIPGEMIGYKAAEALDRMLKGEQVSPEAFLLPPVGVVQRMSTDTFASGDLIVNRALRYMQEHVTEGINVDTVLNYLGCSRSKLDKSFHEHLGRSPLKEIHRLRTEKAKNLLTQTDMSVEEVATACGFNDAQRLWKVFRGETHLSPDAFRRQFRTM